MTRKEFESAQLPHWQTKPKRKPLPKVSKKRRKLMREVGPQRKAFVEDVGTCMVRDCFAKAVDPHEIARGHAREKTLSEPLLQMAVCRMHHGEFDDYSKWPPERQIAELIYWEIERRCLLYNAIRGTAPTHVTAAEVLPYLVEENE